MELPQKLFIVKTSVPVYDGAEAGEKKPPLYRAGSDRGGGIFLRLEWA